MHALEVTLIPFFILKLALTGVGGYLAYQDYRDREVLLWPALIFFVLLLPFWKGDHLFFVAMILLPLIFAFYKKWLAFVDFGVFLGSILVFTPNDIARLFVLTGGVLLCIHII